MPKRGLHFSSLRAAGVPLPADSVLGTLERLHADLVEVQALLSGPEASVRLVLTPEQVVVAEARRRWREEARAAGR